MTTDTDFEIWVRSQLQEIADGVTPRPDPYGRLMRRRRRWWLRLGVLTSVMATALAGGVVAVAPAGSPEPNPTPPHEFRGELRWEARIIDAPVRGSLAADEAFLADLEHRIERRSRDEGDHPMFEDTNGRLMGEVDARVVFAEDIDDTRLVALTLQRVSITSPYQRYGLTRLLWLTGPRGAAAEDLARPGPAPGGSRQFRTIDVAPFAYMQVGRVSVGLAPPECEVSTAPSEDLTSWRVEPTRSWIVRTAADYRPEYWRVTCDGVVREEWPVWRPAITRAEVTAALTDAPGQPRHDQVAGVMAEMTGQYRSELITLPRVLWAGIVSHDEAYDSVTALSSPILPHYDPYHPEVTLLAAPAARGGWIGHLSIDVDPRPESTAPVGTSTDFTTAEDLGAPGTVLGLKVRGWSRMVFVLAPEGAARVQLVAPDGTVIDDAVVTQRALLLSLPAEAAMQAGIRVDAFDSAGAVIATAELGTTGGVESHHIREWR